MGGGVVGLACARSMSSCGADVVLIERGRFGQAASRGNAGWVTRSLAAPVPAPGVMRQAVAWMLKPDSPLLLRPRLDPELWRWSWRFSRNCSASRHTAGAKALLALSERTPALFDELRSAGVQFEMHEEGLLFVALTAEVLEEYAEELRAMRDAGYTQPVETLDRVGVRRLEPALSDDVVGGLFVPSDRHVRPESLTEGLVQNLRSEGVSLLEGHDVVSLSRDGSRGWRLTTRPANAGTEEVSADRVVLAAGAWSARVLAGLGVRLALQPAKGYSITARNAGISPRHALYLAEATIGCSPFAGSVRFAGTLEFAGLDEQVEAKRLAPFARAASTYLRDWRPLEQPVAWAGLRPLAPDGLPYIGAVSGREGLYVATGHGTLGVTLAPATAASVTPLVLEDHLVPELAPFRPDRRV